MIKFKVGILFLDLESLLLSLCTTCFGCITVRLRFFKDHSLQMDINPPPPLLHFKIIPPTPFLKIPHLFTLPPANQSSQAFLINRNTTVKLSSINIVHVKQQHNVGFFIFKFTLKHKHAWQCIY